MKRTFAEALEHRRTYYSIGSDSSIQDEEVVHIIRTAVKFVPSSFNSQSSRVVLLLGSEHTKLWDIVKNKLKPLVSEEQFVKTQEKIDGCFACGHDGKGNILNTNADTIAGETAKALAGFFDVTLIYCFEKKGVLRDENDDDSVIPQITQEEFKVYVEEGVIGGGMIPKLENAFDALNAGVCEVVITLSSAINGKFGTLIRK